MSPIGRAKNLALVLTGLGSALVLAGCQPEPLRLCPLSANLAMPRPAFTVIDAHHPQYPGYQRIEVRERSEACDNGRCSPLWQVDTTAASGPTAFFYGETPVGFELRQGPEPLSPGGKYRLEVSREALGSFAARGSLDFDVDPRGRIAIHLPPGAPPCQLETDEE